MGKPFRKAGRGLAAASGFDKLTGQYARFVRADALYNTAAILSGTFLNVFLLRATGGASAMTAYNLVNSLAVCALMTAAVFLLRRMGVNRCQQAAFLFQGAAFLLLALTAQSGEKTIYLASVLLGAGGACYYLCYQLMLMGYAPDRDRDAAFAALNLSGIVLGLGVPLIAGFVINRFESLAGYRVLFFLSAAASGAGLWASARLAKLPLAGGGRAGLPAFAPAFFALTGTREGRLSMIATLCFTTRSIVIRYFTSYLGYTILKTESAMGVAQAVTGLVGVAASVLYARHVKPHSRSAVMACAALALMAASLALRVSVSVAVWMVFLVVSSATTVFLDGPPLAAHLALMERQPALRDAAPEATAMREVFVGVGNVLGLLPMVFLRDAQVLPAAPWVMAGCAALLLVGAACVRGLWKAVNTPA